MPLSLMSAGMRCKIKMVTGDATVRKHLGSLGFIEGASVEIIAVSDGNLILGIMDSRVAINSDLARRIIV